MSRPVPSFVILVMLWVAVGGCFGGPRLPYSLDVPAQTVSVLGAPPVSDGRARFREIFCSLLESKQAGGGKERGCEEALSRLTDEPTHVAVSQAGPTLPSHDPRLRLLIVPGLFGDCSPRIPAPFAVEAERLRALGYRIDAVRVSGRSSSAANARQIGQAIAGLTLQQGERLVLLGHSKGAVDVLEFLVTYPDLAAKVAAVVSVAGAINGSPLAESYAETYARWFAELRVGTCEPGDAGALESLRPSARLNWLRTNPLPVSVRYFSLAAFTDRDNVSWLLTSFYDALSAIDPHNDGQLLFFDQIIPGATLLGYANADHWAVAIPFEATQPLLASTIATRNSYPREALLEAMILFVTEHLGRIP